MPRRADNDDYEHGYDDRSEDRSDERYYDEAPPYTRAARPVQQSGLGIASFIIGLGVVLIDVLMFAVIVIMAATNPARFARPGDAGDLAIVIGLVFCGGWVVSLAGLGLGIGGLCQTDRSRGLAIAGVILNSLVIVVVLVLFLIGWTQQRPGGAFRF